MMGSLSVHLNHWACEPSSLILIVGESTLSRKMYLHVFECRILAAFSLKPVSASIMISGWHKAWARAAKVTSASAKYLHTGLHCKAKWQKKRKCYC